MKSLTGRVTTALATLALVVGCASNAYAIAELQLISGSVVKTVYDTDGDGILVYNSLSDGNVGQFSVVVSTGVTKPNTGPVSQPGKMHLNIFANSGAAGDLTILFGDVDFFSPDNYFGYMFMSATDMKGAVRYDAFADENNSLLATSGAGVTQIGSLSGTGAFGSALNGAAVPNGATWPDGNPYSLTQKVKFTFSGALQTASGDFDLQVVPEPASIAMLGGVLLFTCGAIRRRLRRS